MTARFGLRFRFARPLAASLAFALATGGPLGAAPRDVTSRGFTNANRPYAFAFPRDHASHPGYQTEWWYYTGHLQAPDGRRFGYELTFFRFGLRPGDPPPAAGQSRWRGNELFPAHFALTDERDGKFFHVEKFAREALGLGSASAAGLDVRAEDWHLTGRAERDPRAERMTLHARSAQNAIDLVQLPQKPPAIHGHDGISKKSACDSCASHYYSYTRLATSGSLVYDGVKYAVRGLSWMDHEFGSSESEDGMAGWDWFAIQLDDGRDLMLYVLRRRDGSIVPESSGSLVARDGSVRYLPREAFATKATGSWTSPVTHGVYPSGWQVDVPDAGLSMQIDPTVKDQELAFTSGNVSYWEGSVTIRDASGRTLGVGYVELTGYAGAISI